MEGGCPQTLRFAQDLVARNKEEFGLRVNIRAHEPCDAHAAHTDILARDPLHRCAPSVLLTPALLPPWRHVQAATQNNQGLPHLEGLTIPHISVRPHLARET